jgi:hypothetical protein
MAMSEAFRETLVDVWYGVRNLFGEGLAMYSPSGSHWQVRIIGKVYWGYESWPRMRFVGQCKQKPQEPEEEGEVSRIFF